MAKFRSIHTEFWNDTKVVDDFKKDDKFLFLYLLTNTQANQLGCYELSLSQICRDTGYKNAKVIEILKNLEQNLNVIVYDYDTKEIFLKNWYKYNWLNSEKTKKCIEKEFSTVKSDKLKELIYPLYTAYIPHTSKEKEEEYKKKNKKNEKEEKENTSSEAPSSFPPTLNEIISYSLNELKFDDKNYCEKFYNHYQGIGWINGAGQKIIDWQSVFKNWIKRDKKESQSSTYEVGSTKGLPEL